MPINANHVQFFKAQVNDDTENNGGFITNEVVASGVKNNIFPDASKYERENGSTKFRKVFLGLRNPDNTEAIDLKLFIMRPTQANDAVVMVENDKYDSQYSINEFSRRWGAGQMAAAASIGETSITVTPEQAIYQVFQVDDTIAITTRSDTDPSAPLDFYKIVTIADSAGNKVLTLNRGLVNAMPAGAVVSSCVYLPTLGSKVSFEGNAIITTATGTFDLSKIITNNAGSFDKYFTISPIDATNYNVVDDDSNLVIGSGSTLSSFSPINAATNQPFFTIPPEAFTGNLSEEIDFELYSASHPIFLQRIIPAGTDYAAGNSVILAVELESA